MNTYSTFNGGMTMAPQMTQMGTMMGTMNGYAPIGAMPRRKNNNTALYAFLLIAVIGAVCFYLYKQVNSDSSSSGSSNEEGTNTNPIDDGFNDGGNTGDNNNTGGDSGNTGGSTGGDSGNTGGSTGGDSGNTGGSTGGDSGNTGGSTGGDSGNTGGSSGFNYNPTIPSSVPSGAGPFTRDQIIQRAQYWVDSEAPVTKSGGNVVRFLNFRLDVSGFVGWAYNLRASNDGPTTSNLLSTYAYKITKDELKQGDIMLVNGYCTIFVRWVNSDKSKYEMMYISETAKKPVKREYSYPFYMIGGKPEHNLEPYRLKAQYFTEDSGTSTGGGSTGGGSTGGGSTTGYTGAEAVARAKTWVDAQVSSAKVGSNTPRHDGFRVDVSGYVGYAYNIPGENDGPTTTTLLSKYATPINKDDLQPGDIMLVKGYCTIFVKWLNTAKTKYRMYYISENQKKARQADYDYPFYMIGGNPEYDLKPYRINSQYRKD